MEGLHDRGERSEENEAGEEERDLPCPGRLVEVRIVVFG